MLVERRHRVHTEHVLQFDKKRVTFVVVVDDQKTASRKRNWYWKDFFLFFALQLSLPAPSLCRSRRNGSWVHCGALVETFFILLATIANNMWFFQTDSHSIFSFSTLLSVALPTSIQSGQTTMTTTNHHVETETIENIYSNKCTYIEHTGHMHMFLVANAVHHAYEKKSVNRHQEKDEKKMSYEEHERKRAGETHWHAV